MHTDKMPVIFSGNREDESVFHDLYLKHYDELYRFTLLRVSNTDVASDIVQEVFRRLLVSTRGRERQIDEIRAFLYRMTKNCVIDHYRNTVVTYSIDTDESDDRMPLQIPYEGVGADVLVDREFTAEEIRKALSTLKANSREIVEMRYLQQLEIEEIADRLGKSEGAVRVQIHRAIEELRAVYERTKD